MMKIKNIIYINRKAPCGTIHAVESLESVLMASAFSQNISLVFIDDGVYQIIKSQNSADINMKNFSKTYHALGDYGINNIYLEQQSLITRGLTIDDIMPLTYEDENNIQKSSIQIVESSELSKIITAQDICFSF